VTIVEGYFSIFLRCIIKTTTEYIAYIRQSNIELAPFLALVGAVLTAGEGVVMWVLSGLAPMLAQEWEKTDRYTRMLVCEVLPAVIILVWGILCSGWLMLWRQNRQ
jgi:hypothetical protein